MKPPPALSVDVEALRDVLAPMSPAEAGIYSKLWPVCWREGSVPDDAAQLARLCGCSAREFGKVWPAVRQRFTEQAGRLLLAWIEEQRRRLDQHREGQRTSGQRGARARWGAHRQPMATPLGSASAAHGDPIGQPMATPSGTPPTPPSTAAVTSLCSQGLSDAGAHPHAREADALIELFVATVRAAAPGSAPTPRDEWRQALLLALDVGNSPANLARAILFAHRGRGRDYWAERIASPVQLVNHLPALLDQRGLARPAERGGECLACVRPSCGSIACIVTTATAQAQTRIDDGAWPAWARVERLLCLRCNAPWSRWTREPAFGAGPMPELLRELNSHQLSDLGERGVIELAPAGVALEDIPTPVNS